MGDAAGWTIDGLDFRAPGSTHVAFSGSGAAPDNLAGALDVESCDPDVLVAWLQGALRHRLSQSKAATPARQRADRSGAHLIEALNAEIDGGTVEGRLVLSQQAAGSSQL